MRAPLPSLVRNVRHRDFFAWCLTFCFAGLAVAASAQSQSPDPVPDANAPVAIPPDALAQPQPNVQPPPENWDRSWKFEKVTDDDDWTRHFRVGALVGLNISANFNTKSDFSLSGNNAALGNYDDGYVHPSGNGPFTADWGYEHASQYDVSQHQLSMHQATSFSPDTGTSSESSGSAFAGFDLAYGGNLVHWGSTIIGWDFGFGLLPVNFSNKLSTSGQVNRNIYTFDTSGIDAYIPFPSPGYHGGPGGSLSLPGGNGSSSGTDSINGDISGSRTLDVTLYSFRLGPSVYWDLNQYFGLSAGIGPAVGIVSGNLKYNETITEHTADGDVIVKSKGQVDGTDVVYGGYANATLMYHLVENGDLYLGVQYMSLGNANISGGGRSAQLNLGGQIYISAGINWPF